MIPSDAPDDLSPAAAHNTWWRNRGFTVLRKRRGPFNARETKFHVPYEDRHLYDSGVQLEIDGENWEVISVIYQPEKNRAVVSCWPAGAMERHNRGEG